MPAPLVAGAYALFALGSISSGGYHVGKAVENSRFWKDYYRNTHRAPRYPYRVGRYDYLRDFSKVSYGAGFGFRGVQKLR